ncbi:hypothetical protein GGI04_005966, partial [Coemansia thaxteri]
MAYQPKTQQPVGNSSHLMNYGIDSSDYYYNPAYAVSTAALCQSQGDHHLDYSHINADTSEDPTYVSDVHKAVEVADASLVSTSACLPGTSGKSSLFGAGLAASPVISGDPAGEQPSNNSLGLSIARNASDTQSVVGGPPQFAEDGHAEDPHTSPI